MYKSQVNKLKKLLCFSSFSLVAMKDKSTDTSDMEPAPHLKEFEDLVNRIIQEQLVNLYQNGIVPKFNKLTQQIKELEEKQDNIKKNLDAYLPPKIPSKDVEHQSNNTNVQSQSNARRVDIDNKDERTVEITIEEQDHGEQGHVPNVPKTGQTKPTFWKRIYLTYWGVVERRISFSDALNLAINIALEQTGIDWIICSILLCVFFISPYLFAILMFIYILYNYFVYRVTTTFQPFIQLLTPLLALSPLAMLPRSQSRNM